MPSPWYIVHKFKYDSWQGWGQSIDFSSFSHTSTPRPYIHTHTPPSIRSHSLPARIEASSTASCEHWMRVRVIACKLLAKCTRSAVVCSYILYTRLPCMTGHDLYWTGPVDCLLTIAATRLVCIALFLDCCANGGSSVRSVWRFSRKSGICALYICSSSDNMWSSGVI